MARVREYWRCPCCGKANRIGNYQFAVADGHRLHVLTCETRGRGHGADKQGRPSGGAFAWSQRAMTVAELDALAEIVAKVDGRLKLALKMLRQRGVADNDGIENLAEVVSADALAFQEELQDEFVALRRMVELPARVSTVTRRTLAPVCARSLPPVRVRRVVNGG